MAKHTAALRTGLSLRAGYFMVWAPEAHGMLRPLSLLQASSQLRQKDWMALADTLRHCVRSQ